MLAGEVARLEKENDALKTMVQELTEQLEQGGKGNPRACKYCKNYIQHYGRWDDRYKEIYAGHCVSGVPINRGGKKHPAPDESCPYFELGTYER